MNTWTAVITHSLQPSHWAAGWLDLLLKSFILLLVAGGLCLGWRRSAAATRHLVWFLALAGALSLPVLTALLPAWQRPLWTVGTQADAENELTLTLELTPDRAALHPVTPAAGAAATTITSMAQSTRGQRLATHFRAGWVTLAVVTWAGGLGAVLLTLVTGRLSLRKLRRNARVPVNPKWTALVQQLAAELRIDRRVTLLQATDDLMPVTWGWWRPVILLPAGADDWSPERRRVVLLHELSHVKRWDCLTQTIARLACAVYWFNPLVWLAARRMCVEREHACDDLVLDGGCKASDYAAHLVDIARTFRRVPHVTAIAMARSPQLQGRIAAIVDAARVRRNPRALLVVVCGCAVLAFTATVAAQKPDALVGDTITTKPWYDARLRSFFDEKGPQARQLAGTNQVAIEVWPYFAAGSSGDWSAVTNLYAAMRQRAHQYEGTKADNTLDRVWSPILETELAREQFVNWQEKYVLAYGNDIIKSIPPGSIYFGGTDPGRGVITAMSENQVDGKPFYTLTQNALADSTYLDYLQAMYGQALSMPSHEDSQKAFADYTTDVAQRSKENKLLPGENMKVVDGKPQVTGQIAVMNINGLIAKTVFDRNPGHEFYIEESFPLNWMYPYLTPNGLIMKINREPLPEISAAILQQDRDYWMNYLKPMIGDWLNDDTTVADVTAFSVKAYQQHNLDGFTGDPQFAADTWSQKGFSKLRSSIAGVFDWRVDHAQTPEEKARMTKAADLAYRQALALCPTSPEAIYRYVNFLMKANRLDDAILVAQTGWQLNPDNGQLPALVQQLQRYKAKH